MGLQTFNVIFDNPNGVYFAGQHVQGHVHVQLVGESLKTRGVVLKFSGRAEVFWTEKKTEHRSSQNDADGNSQSGFVDTTIEHRDEESYFDSKVYVFGNGSETYLAPGEHYFPFQFLLPATIPSSFEGEHGHVRYMVKAKVDRPWAFDPKAKAFFTVNNILDLNADMNASKPAQAMDHKHLCCFCCRSGPISALVNIPRTGFVPGEKIVLNAEIDNKSRRSLSGSEVQLIQRVTFHAGHEEKKLSKIIVTGQRGEVEPGETDSWHNFELFVPSVPPSVLAYCSIIHLEYLLKFSVSPSGMATDLTLTLPLTIGSVPLSSTFDQFAPPPPYVPPVNQAAYPPPQPQPNPAPMQPPNPGGDLPYPAQNQPPGVMPPVPMGGATAPGFPQPSAPKWPVQQYPNLPPPAYEESVLGGAQLPLRTADDNEHTEGNWEFIPKYVTFIPKTG